VGNRVKEPAVAESSAGLDAAIANQAEAVTAKAPSRSTWRKVYLAALAVSILGAGSWAVWYRTRPLPVPAGIETIANTLIVKDAQGRELWRHEFPWPLDPMYRLPYEAGKIWFAADVDGDGETEVVFGYYPETLPENEASRPNDVFCFSEDGKRTKWRFGVGRPKVSTVSGIDYFPPYWLSNVKLVPGSSPSRTRIVVSSFHHVEYPNQVAVLDGQGKLVGEYWHPGHLMKAGFADLDGDGKQKLLLAGVNNAQHAATLVVFDPDNVRGTAAGLAEPRLGFQGLPQGTEEAVVLFPRTCLAVGGPKQEPYNRVTNLIVTKDRLQVEVSAGVSAADPREILYDLDYGLHALAVDAFPPFQQAHREWERAGILKHSLYPDEIKRFADDVIVRRRHPEQ
jgi:hypothetical protein